MYKKVKSHLVPKRERKSESLFEITPDWKRMRADIDNGLEPGESCYLQFSLDDWERVGLSGKAMEGRRVASGCYAVQRFIKKYLKATGRKYTVGVRNNDGFDLVVVDGPKLKPPGRKA